VQLGGQELNLIPFRQIVAGYAHGADPAVMSDLRETLLGQVLDVLEVRLLDPAVVILVESLVRRSVVWLWVLYRPGTDLVSVDPDLPLCHPCVEPV